MKLSCIPHGLASALALSLCAPGAFAASGALQALSETELGDVYGRGLSEPTLTALGALTTQEQGSSAVSAPSAVDGTAALAADSLQGMDRQMAQQRLQAGATGLQLSLKITQTLLSLSNALAPLGGNGALPLLPFPLLFMLPSLPSLNAIQNKH